MAEPTFKRDAAAEKAAVDAGIATAAQIEARGGINASGYYGDSYREGITLTDQEYANAILAAKGAGATGAEIGGAVNTASGTKAYNFYVGKGLTPEQAEIISGYTSKGAPSTIYGPGVSKAAADLYAKLQAGTISQTMFNNLINRIEVNPNLLSDGSTTASSSNVSGNTATSGFGPGSEGYEERKSAYDLLFEQFNQYGLGALVAPLKSLIIEGVSPSEFTLRLRDTDAYKKRFAANQQRIAKGLRALSEAEYIGLEDQYQNVMRNYGLPESYYTRGDMGRQEGFERFIAGDVSAVELEDRIQTAQNRVINAAPEISATLKQYYPNLSNGDILAYVLDPEKAITDIKRKVTAAEIGGAAAMAGLATGVSRAEELARYGVTAESARQGYQTIADIAPRGSQLAEIYKQTPYTQTTAEQEVFGLTGATEAATRRKKLQQLEQASFSGSAGIAGGALARDRAGAF